jgi:hypothetical protein
LERTVSAFNNDVAPSNQPQRRSKTKAFLLLGLVIIFILAGLGLVTYPTITSQFATGTSQFATGPATTNHTTETASNRIDLTATFNADASATMQASLATSHANATTQANLTTTALAQTATASVQSTATASTLEATVTAQAKITATAQAVAATATVYATTITAGTPMLNDPLQDNSQGHNWDVTSIPGGGGCAFADGAYHSSMPQQGYFSPCFAEATNFTNFSYQIQMTFVKGDQGGIAFRGNAQKGAFYYFHINRNGTYALEIYDNDISTGVVKQGSSPAIKTGLNQTNLMAVVANGNQIDLYVNMQHIDSITDSTYSSGQIGVVAEDITNPTDVAFSNAQVWTR